MVDGLQGPFYMGFACSPAGISSRFPPADQNCVWDQHGHRCECEFELCLYVWPCDKLATPAASLVNCKISNMLTCQTWINTTCIKCGNVEISFCSSPVKQHLVWRSMSRRCNKWLVDLPFVNDSNYQRYLLHFILCNNIDTNTYHNKSTEIVKIHTLNSWQWCSLTQLSTQSTQRCQRCI